MARVIHVAGTGPVKLDPSPKPYFICACGLTKNFPHCDGSHKACRDEPEGKTFRYQEGTRHEVDDRGDGGHPGGACCGG